MMKRKLELLKPLVVRFGLYKLAYWFWHHIHPTLRSREKEHRREYLQFKEQCSDALKRSLVPTHGIKKRALIVSTGFGGVKVELGLIKSIELAGYQPIVLTDRDPWLVKYYQLAGVETIKFWDQFVTPLDPLIAKEWLGDCHSLDDLLGYEYAGARVGKYTASTALRYLRRGELDLQAEDVRQHIHQYLHTAMEYALASQKIISNIRPIIALTLDPGYTPRGELYDACLAAGVDSITWNAAHKSNTLMLKRYTRENRDVHPSSLSDDTWRQLLEVEWNESFRQQLRQELYSSYASGDWYSEVGTQFNTRMLENTELQERLGLDPYKKTAFIFPHIFWDGTFFWGTDLFDSYEEWFLETVRAACKNDQVNWVIKVHPANLVKNQRDGVDGEPSEVVAIRAQIGRLPAHIHVIPADSEINTYSLYRLMDYCVTVRGTVGIEAASFGVPVLTAGTGRYNDKGFTIDSQTREQYLDQIKSIQKILPLTARQRELAERFAYGVFVLRPLDLQTVTLEYQQDSKATSKTRINIQKPDDLVNAPDLMAISAWIRSGKEDFDFSGG
jgi:hypothetical protein